MNHLPKAIWPVGGAQILTQPCLSAKPLSGSPLPPAHMWPGQTLPTLGLSFLPCLVCVWSRASPLGLAKLN